MEWYIGFSRISVTREEESQPLKQLMDLPEEVVEGHILPLLKWNDLLRTSRVSKHLNRIVQKYIKLHQDLVPEIEINETNRTLEEFLNLNIPATKFFLNNDKTGEQFYDNPDMQEFLQMYGSKITHLRVAATTYGISCKERNVLDALTNLESLEAARFEVNGNVGFTEPDEIQLPMDYRIPDSILRLKSLKVGSHDRKRDIRGISLLTLSLINECLQLEYVMQPFSELLKPIDGGQIEEEAHVNLEFHVLALTFRNIQEAIQKRHLQFPDQPNLKNYDFEHYHVARNSNNHHRLFWMHRIAGSPFIGLCRECLLHQVKLENVVALWLPELFDGEYENIDPAFGHPIVSLIDLNPSVFALDLVNLKQLDIKGTSGCLLHFDWKTDRPFWPSLKKLVITLDSEIIELVANPRGRITDFNCHADSNIIFSFFFKNTTRTALTELELVFKIVGKKMVPSVNDIITACPNLTKLTIVNWPGTNIALVKLWNGLSAFKEVCLDGCKELGNVAFVGEDTDNPVFLKLKNLKKLSLKKLDQMPKITDTLFNLVLKWMSLTHLTLTSGKPLKKITPAGIRSLLTGSFASSIEKFPFKEWSFENTSDDEFMELEAEFRSYNMI